MFSRLDHDIPAVLFPKDWAESLKQILLNIYGDKCLKEEKTFEVYGFSFPTEALMIVSYVGLDKTVSPVTLFLSADLDEKTETDSIMDQMFDSVGVFFDNYFAHVENSQKEEALFDEYIFDWQEMEYQKQVFYYKVTRENIALTLEADLLLGK